MAPNMSKILYNWGLEDEVRSIAVKSESISILLCMLRHLSVRAFLRLFKDDSGEILGHHHWDEEVLKETQGEFVFAHVSIPHQICCGRSH
jgi:salicylate hydroxylase